MSDRPDSFDAFMIGILCLGIGTICVVVTHTMMLNSWQTECVQRGAAEWVVEDNGSTEFRWLMELEEKP